MPLKNYINGRWVDSRTGETFASINPATKEVLGEVPKSGARDVDDAVQAAVKAWDKWRHTPAPARAQFVYRVAQLLTEKKEEMARLMTREMGKVLVESRGDVQEAIDMCTYMAGEGRRLFGYTTPSELPDKAAMAVREPAGVVAAVTPWNVPMAIPSWKVAPALVAGDTVVLKPASDTPLVAIAFVEMFEQAGLPPGVLNLVTGSGAQAGEALIQHPDIDVVSFTGSTAVGREVGMLASGNLKKATLELGGKNAIIVMDDAAIDLAVDGIVWSAFGTSGQRCTAASRVIAQRAVKDELVSKVAEKAKRLRVGNGLDESVQMGPIVNGVQLERVRSYVEIGKGEAARLVTGGEVCTEGECANGFFYRPTVFDDVRPDMRIAQEEIFGPVTSIIAADSLEEAINIANGTRYGLSSSIYTRDVDKAFRAMRDLRTGIVYVNAGTIGAEVHLPFGGMCETGNGHREAGQAAIDIYTEWKTVYVDYSGRLQRAQIDEA